MTSFPEKTFILPSEFAREHQIGEEQSCSDITFLRNTGKTLTGALNINYILTDGNENCYILRIPKVNPGVLPTIEDELLQTGFFLSGGSYRLRTPQEQVDFMGRAASLGLKTIVPVWTNGAYILLPYLEGSIPFDAYLKQGGVTAIGKALDNLRAAYREGLIFGDRWVKNTLIILGQQDGDDVLEVDFDIEIAGERAVEFEVAQTLYHILHFASDKETVLKYLISYFQRSNLLQSLALEYLAFFLKKYANYFQDKEYEGISSDLRQEVDALISSFIS